jgi:hypothetical protein
MIEIPLSQSGPADQFAKAVEAHRAAVEAHTKGPAGKPAPRASALVESLIRRVPQDGPVADRGPDHITIAEYEIVDDTPVSPEVQFLRDSIGA